MIRRVVQVPVYLLIVGMAVMIASPLASIFASVQIAERNAEQVRAKQQAAQVVATRLACEQFGRLIDAFDDATTPIGREVRGVYVFLYTLIRCEPPRR